MQKNVQFKAEDRRAKGILRPRSKRDEKVANKVKLTENNVGFSHSEFAYAELEDLIRMIYSLYPEMMDKSQYANIIAYIETKRFAEAEGGGREDREALYRLVQNIQEALSLSYFHKATCLIEGEKRYKHLRQAPLSFDKAASGRWHKELGDYDNVIEYDISEKLKKLLIYQGDKAGFNSTEMKLPPCYEAISKFAITDRAVLKALYLNDMNKKGASEGTVMRIINGALKNKVESVGACIKDLNSIENLDNVALKSVLSKYLRFEKEGFESLSASTIKSSLVNAADYAELNDIIEGLKKGYTEVEIAKNKITTRFILLCHQFIARDKYIMPFSEYKSRTRYVTDMVRSKIIGKMVQDQAAECASSIEDKPEIVHGSENINNPALNRSEREIYEITEKDKIWLNSRSMLDSAKTEFGGREVAKRVEESREDRFQGSDTYDLNLEEVRQLTMKERARIKEEKENKVKKSVSIKEAKREDIQADSAIIPLAQPAGQGGQGGSPLGKEELRSCAPPYNVRRPFTQNKANNSSLDKAKHPSRPPKQFNIVIGSNKSKAENDLPSAKGENIPEMRKPGKNFAYLFWGAADVAMYILFTAARCLLNGVSFLARLCRPGGRPSQGR